MKRIIADVVTAENYLFTWELAGMVFLAGSLVGVGIIQLTSAVGQGTSLIPVAGILSGAFFTILALWEGHIAQEKAERYAGDSEGCNE